MYLMTETLHPPTIVVSISFRTLVYLPVNRTIKSMNNIYYLYHIVRRLYYNNITYTIHITV